MSNQKITPYIITFIAVGVLSKSWLLAFAVVCLAGSIKLSRQKKKSEQDDEYTFYADVSTSHTLEVDDDFTENESSELPVPTKNVLAVNQKSLPPEVFNLIWFLDGPYRNLGDEYRKTQRYYHGNTVYTFEQFPDTSEPSAISIDWQIKKGVDDSPLGYFPSYRTMSPGQRYNYVNWLLDVTQPIDIGYVFTFYYGLERHILYGNLDEAVKMILKLRKYHSHKSFQSYSTGALIAAAIIDKRVDLIGEIAKDPSLFPRHYLTVKIGTQKYIDADDVIVVAKEVGFTNDRYIRNEPELFKTKLEEQISNTYGEKVIRFPENPTLEIQNEPLTLANISLTDENRKVNFPTFFADAKLTGELRKLLQDAHEATKVELREIRKKQRLEEKEKQNL